MRSGPLKPLAYHPGQALWHPGETNGFGKYNAIIIFALPGLLVPVSASTAVAQGGLTAR